MVPADHRDSQAGRWGSWTASLSAGWGTWVENLPGRTFTRTLALFWTPYRLYVCLLEKKAL